jgi:hypothetical protein
MNAFPEEKEPIDAIVIREKDDLIEGRDKANLFIFLL